MKCCAGGKWHETKKTLLLMLGVLAGLCVAIAAVLGLEKHIDSINAVNEEIISLAPIR